MSLSPGRKQVHPEVVKEALLTDIQHFSLHDGPGIRTTVFFKGCPLRCRWCHNPEAISFKKDLMFYEQLCSSCGKCSDACREDCLNLDDPFLKTDRSNCTLCGSCTELCPQGALELKGRAYSVDEIVEECLIDRDFYRDNGGVTLSGGEPLRQPALLFPLMKKLKQQNLNLVLDSCGHADISLIEESREYVDLYHYDLKCMDSERHKKWTSMDNTLILENLEYLMKKGAPLIIRTPVIAGFNNIQSEMESMADFLGPYARRLRVHFLPYHSLGVSKYRALGQEPSILEAPSVNELNSLKIPLEERGIQVDIFNP